MDEDSNIPEITPESDQIVKIDFSEAAPVDPEPIPSYAAHQPLFRGSQIMETIEDLGTAMQENHRQLGWIKAEMGKYSAIIPKIEALQKEVEHGNKLESTNQKLFNTMHEELKSYKDNFLFDALQKPMIRDLLVIFDDLCGQNRRMGRFISEHPPSPENEEAGKNDAELRAARENVNNTVHFLIEILQRLDVWKDEGHQEKLDLKLHKVVGVEPTELPQEQNTIARVVRPGFFWRDRVLRPTEVIIKKISPPIEKTGKK